MRRAGTPVDPLDSTGSIDAHGRAHQVLTRMGLRSFPGNARGHVARLAAKALRPAPAEAGRHAGRPKFALFGKSPVREAASRSLPPALGSACEPSAVIHAG